MTVVYQTTDLNSPIPVFNHRHFERGHTVLVNEITGGHSRTRPKVTKLGPISPARALLVVRAFRTGQARVIQLNIKFPSENFVPRTNHHSRRSSYRVNAFRSPSRAISVREEL